ncbi:MAG: DUF2344 domain-containing protein, partial [Deltaproteobacteria bacterium]|nr:DUF2344 domain-containing protein [Deltaproteobacteria bacterium]
RDVINKGLTEDQILHSAKEIYEGGWNLIKLYFMIGLPSEEDSDLVSIIELSKKISRLGPQGRKGNVLNVSISPFVPKAHTPFAWLPQLELEEGKRRINFIRERLQSRRVKVKWNNPEASWLEGIFSRGDRRLTRVLLEAWQIEAWQNGAHFDSWSEHLNIDIWKEALKRCNLDPDFYILREREHDEVLPWEHIHSGISKEFLLSEWQKAMDGKTTPDCRQYCSNCGVCSDNDISPVLFDTWHPLEEKKGLKPKQPNEQGKTYRLCFTKLEKTKYLSQLELIKVFIRAFRRAGMDIVYSSGYHPMPKLSDVQAKNIQNTSLTIRKINKELPSGIRVLSMEEIGIKETPPRIKESYFYIQMNGYFNKEAVDRFLTCLAVKKRRNSEITVDIRSQVKALNVLSNSELELIVRYGKGPELKPAEIIKNVFTLHDSQIEGMRILKTKSIII